MNSRTFIVVVLGALAIISSCSSQHPASPTTTTTPATIATTKTTVAPPTTISVQVALAAAVTVQDTNAGLDCSQNNDGASDVCVGLTLRNTSSRPIAALQWRDTISATDSLGRTFTFTGINDCPAANLGVGSSRSSPIPSDPHLSDVNQEITALDDEAQAVSAGIDNCTIAVYEMNEFIGEQIGLYNAISNGAVPKLSVRLTRVSFVGGGGIGTAENGSAPGS